MRALAIVAVRGPRAAPRRQVYPLVVGVEPIPPRGRHFFSVALSTCRWLGSFVGVVGEKLRVQGGACAGEQLLEYSGLLTRSEGECRRQQRGDHAPGQRPSRTAFARTPAAPPHLLNGAFALVLPGLGILSSRSLARAQRAQLRPYREQPPPPPPQDASRATAQGRAHARQTAGGETRRVYQSREPAKRSSSFETSAHLLLRDDPHADASAWGAAEERRGSRVFGVLLDMDRGTIQFYSAGWPIGRPVRFSPRVHGRLYPAVVLAYERGMTATLREGAPILSI